MLFFDQAAAGALAHRRQEEILESLRGARLDHIVASLRGGPVHDGSGSAGAAVGAEGAREPVGEDVVLLRAFLGDDGLDGPGEFPVVPLGAGPDERDEQIATGHGVLRNRASSRKGVSGRGLPRPGRAGRGPGPRRCRRRQSHRSPRRERGTRSRRESWSAEGLHPRR